jgi:hypothetical protein
MSKVSRLQRLTEQSVANELQTGAEKAMGKMEETRGDTTLEFLLKFYRFYLDQMPKKVESHRDKVKMAMCVTLAARILNRGVGSFTVTSEDFIARAKALTVA